jgi:hypothetical protein
LRTRHHAKIAEDCWRVYLENAVSLKCGFGPCAFFAAAIFLCTASAIAQTVAVQRIAASGIASPISNERAWDWTSCAAQTVVVTIVEQPKNGTVTIRDETMNIPATTNRAGSTGVCAGKPINGKRVYYQSRPGFFGTDRLVYSTNYGGHGTAMTVIEISVK